MPLYLIRHPAPAIAPAICYGQSDIDLLHPVEDVLPALQTWLPESYSLYSSPLKRCARLAEALHPAPQFDERLKELHFGQWELQPFDNLPRSALDDWAANPIGYKDHGGESVAEMQLRIAAFLENLPFWREHAVVVCHAGVMRIISGLLLGLPQAEWLSMKFEYASVSKIDIVDGKLGLVWHNSAHV